MREIRFNPGEVIIKEGTFGSSAYLLKSGVVEVRRKGPKREVLLATLKGEEIFGEMGLIDDKPRSASVVAKTPVTVDEIVRDDFFALLDDKVAFIIPILKAFFEHLRQTNDMVVYLENKMMEGESETAAPAPRPESLRIEGITKETRELLSNKTTVITKFPYKIGRQSSHRTDDIFVDNDLFFQDEVPFNISRNHLSLNIYKNTFYVLDRGSSIGTIVNGKHIGAKQSVFKADLQKGENVVILGSDTSPFKLKIIV
ncbi:MAG: cyclic nucleotide-binding domain-containing protein [Candidatus Neomarinimicrobiota bacterium]